MTTTEPRTQTPASPERGAVAVIVALTIFPLLLIAAYATDLGLWLHRSQQIQRAADLAALAGAAEMPNATSAQSVAMETLRRNGFNPCPGAGCDPNVVASVTFPEPGQIRVSIQDTSVSAVLAQPVVGDISIGHSATSTYLPELLLGSPTNRFGAESVPVATTDQQLFASVPGLGTRTQDGSPFLTCPGVVPASYNGCGASNPTYDGRGYYYAIDVGAEDLGVVTVELFDAGFDPGATCTWPNGTCDRAYGYGGPNSGHSTVTYEVLAADSTPWDWHDNTVGMPGCQRAYDQSNSGPTIQAWTTLCTFNATAPGLYIMNVRSSNYPAWAAGATAYADDGADYNYSVRATSSNPGGEPDVHGLGAASFFTAVSTDRDAAYWLAGVDPAYRGHTLQFDIYDPGELPANSALQLMTPAGTPASCSHTTLNYTRTAILAGPTNAPTCRVVVTGGSTNASLFNRRWLRMEVTLPDTYTCTPVGAGCFWWMLVDLDPSVTDGAGNPVNGTERSVFTAQVLGDPIRLIE